MYRKYFHRQKIPDRSAKQSCLKTKPADNVKPHRTYLYFRGKHINSRTPVLNLPIFRPIKKFCKPSYDAGTISGKTSLAYY